MSWGRFGRSVRRFNRVVGPVLCHWVAYLGAPLVPSLPDDDDATKYGRSAHDDAKNFPSDEQLSQRILWIAFLIVLGWTILGLAGALPLYLINTPCLAKQPTTSEFGGSYSVLQDLSLMRLLELLDRGD
ncbi:hypothetical protein MPER_05627, partial [Moniliophthora perniciosa FA553]